MWAANFWPGSYWNARYWPKNGQSVTPPAPPATPAPEPPIFQPPLTYDWTRGVSGKSSIIAQVSYNGAQQRMQISYKGGGQDIFVGVGDGVAESLTSTGFPDQFFLQNIFGKLNRQ